MSYWIVNTGGNNSLLRYFQCDFLSDINKLPTVHKKGYIQTNDTVSSYTCAPGSQCLCQEDGSLWLLGMDTDKWVCKKSFGGGSGGEENIEPISNTQIESLFT